MTIGRYPYRNGFFLRFLPCPEYLPRPSWAWPIASAHRERSKLWRALAAARVGAGCSLPVAQGRAGLRYLHKAVLFAWRVVAALAPHILFEIGLADL